MLYATSDNEVEEIFTISTSDEDVRLEISDVQKAHGCGLDVLDCFPMHKHSPVFAELSLLTCGFALFLADRLYYGTTDVPGPPIPNFYRPIISANTLHKAAGYLFDFGIPLCRKPSNFVQWKSGRLRSRSHWRNFLLWYETT